MGERPSFTSDDAPALQLGPGALCAAITIALVVVAACHKAWGWVPILDSANLAFHEAGHPIYGIFGQTLMLYGGTLGQLTFPIVVLVSCWRKAQAAGVAFAAIWLGENFLNIARYCADARAQELPLVGGGEHDWFNILTRWHALNSDIAIGHAIVFLSWMLMASVWFWSFWRWQFPPR